jgi:hypothetical protein
MKSGKTRVFLAHGDGRPPDRGSIFGYFVLRGVDIVLTESDYDLCKEIAAKYRKTPSGATDSAVLRTYWKTPAGRQAVEPLLDFWRDRLGRWNLPYPLPEHGQLQEPLTDDLLDFLSHFEVAGEPGGAPNAAGYILCGQGAALEDRRECPPDGLRLGSERPSARGRPSLYLVCEREREIIRVFCNLLRKMRGAVLDAKIRETGRDQYLRDVRAGRTDVKPSKRGIKAFDTTVHKARTVASIPENLGFPVTACGAVLAFEKPYPFFLRQPRAYSRTPIGIDGDKLLERIAAAYGQSGKRHVRLPLWGTLYGDLHLWGTARTRTSTQPVGASASSNSPDVSP